MKPLKPRHFRRYARYVGKILLLLACLLGLAYTAAAQHTYRLSKAPYYKSFKKVQLNQGTGISYLPVSVDEKTRTDFFYQGREKTLQPLIETLNRHLDSLGFSRVIGSQFSSVSKGAPYLFVGSAESEIAPPSVGILREEFDRFPPMVMHIDKPSKEWQARFAKHLEAAQTEFGLLFWIGFNEYPKANKGLFKKKVVLGTNYEPEIRFLSAEDKPVEVLQISAMLINKKGDIIKAGSEAILHEDSPFWVQALETNTTIDDNTIHRLIYNIRREDLPGKPLAWQMALHHLLHQTVQHPTNLIVDRR